MQPKQKQNIKEYRGTLLWPKHNMSVGILGGDQTVDQIVDKWQADLKVCEGSRSLGNRETLVSRTCTNLKKDCVSLVQLHKKQ